jgi:hypothetical protein
MRQRVSRGPACLLCSLLVAGSALAQSPAPPDAAPAAAASEPSAVTPPANASAGTTTEPTAGASTGAPSGFSWSGVTPKPKRSRRVLPRVDLSKPIATYPGFRMLAGGNSEVWLRVSQPVLVTRKRVENRLRYFMPGTQVGVYNNTNPLVTTHFNSPIAWARLRRVRGGAELIVQLRESIDALHATTREPGGTMLLRVTVGKAAREYASRIQPPVSRVATPPAAPPAREASVRRRGPPMMVLPEAGPQL